MSSSDQLLPTNAPDGNGTKPSTGNDQFGAARQAMIETQLRRRGITDHAILSAMAAVPRHEFVPAEFRERAYDDAPLPIGECQTISQPYIVAAMTAALRLTRSDRVLEIGTGLGYQAAILATLAKEIFSIEYRPELASESATRLARLDYENVHVHCGDGTLGLRDFAPFDAILVAAAAPSTPAPLLDQLAHAGRMIIPVGGVENQELRLVERTGTSYQTTLLEPCRFVPLVGAHGWKEAPFR
jgi:protein-L-isoaspartate(D-aspartate) O-methyltransferase